MKNIAVVGTQWGDEGKGKLVDLLAPGFDIVARYQGGHNAGHTVLIGGKKFVLRLVPSGMLNEHCVCVIGNGVVVDAQALVEEIESLEQMGISVEGRLLVSNRAHLILPHHREIERVHEDRLGTQRVGTTMRGIGPAYEEKARRHGVRAAELLKPSELRAKLDGTVSEINRMLEARGEPRLSAEAYDEYFERARRLAPLVTDTAVFLNDAVAAGKRVLLEGAQGTMLDIDHGSYPYVTSSSSTVGGACTGTGLPPTRIDGVIGIAKAYTTRVGAGPFPTELEDERGRHLQERGNEFGSVTGRPRRTGWFDVPVARYAAMVNGLSTIALTKMDVLDDLDEIKVCVAYAQEGERTDRVPARIEDFGEVEAIYETLPGWKSSTLGISRYQDLPDKARTYVDFLAEKVGVEIGLISTGPDREETIVREGSLIAKLLDRTPGK
jgi:adenylosuccinate synthase